MIFIGALAGFFVVPMNALLQHRGHILMGAGHSIAVQNFNENLSILVMLAVYALLLWLDFSIYTVVIIFGLFVAGAMELVRRRHRYNVKSGPLPVIPIADTHAPQAGTGHLAAAVHAAQDDASSSVKRPET
jgi:hypothetical protein